MAVKSIENINELEELIKDGIVVLDFYADWCGPCKMIAPIVEQLSEEMKDVKFAKINTDNLQDVAAKYEIMSIPTLIKFKNGEIIDRVSGFLPKESLEKFAK